MSKTSPSLGLALICKSYDEVERIVSLYNQYFDEIYVQINGGGKKPSEVPHGVHISTFKWCHDFAKARNALLKETKTDYWMWLDSDDTLQNPEGLREIVQMMEADGHDAVYLPYEYGFNEQRELIALHWRERIIKRSHPFEWKGAVHETLISKEGPTGVKDDRVVVTHTYKDMEDQMKSAIRNHKILEKAVKKHKDPRDLFYLGRSYFMLEDYVKAAQTLLEYTEVSGWEEQKYDAWMKIGDCLLMLDEYDKSINANLEAIKLNPGIPDAYLKMGDLYLHLKQPGRAIDWLKMGMSKPKPETLEIQDPTLYTYRPLISLALCFFQLARVDMAKKYIDEAKKYKPLSPMFKSAYNVITDAYIEEHTIKQAVLLGKFVEQQGKIKPYIDGLPPFIKNDLRLRPLRIKAYPAKKWPEKSIVFYCGEQWEDWGPDELAKGKGAGGSEEAIIYLSRELAKLGWSVTVYNQRVEEYQESFTYEWLGDELHPQKARHKKDCTVTYLPWETFNPEDEFDVFIAWRQPWFCQKLKIKARVKGVDMHDTPLGHQAIPPKALESLDLVFLKTEFQRIMGDYEIPKEKAVIAPNGLVPEQFVNPGIKRNPHKLIYASSADRGLDVLVRDVMPKVLEEFPDAELVWPYGWESYDGMHKGNPTQMKWKWELKRDMHKVGAKELGRLSHEELAEEFMSAGIWAYPTYFDEIDCITAKKAQAAGCDAITTGRAALQTSVLKDEKDDPDIENFTKRLLDAMRNPISDEERERVSKEVLAKFAWSSVAKIWDKALCQSSK